MIHQVIQILQKLDKAIYLSFRLKSILSIRYDLSDFT